MDLRRPLAHISLIVTKGIRVHLNSSLQQLLRGMIMRPIFTFVETHTQGRRGHSVDAWQRLGSSSGPLIPKGALVMGAGQEQASEANFVSSPSACDQHGNGAPSTPR